MSDKDKILDKPAWDLLLGRATLRSLPDKINVGDMHHLPTTSDHTFEDSIAEIKAFEEANKPYYRILANDEEETLEVVELQPFDEDGYDQSKFMTTKHYETEELAEQALLAFKLKLDMPLTLSDRAKVIALLEENQ